MLIADIGEVVDTWKKIQLLDAAIDNAKAGRIVLQINGAGWGQDMAEAVQGEVISYLRKQRSALVSTLNDKGFTE